MTRVAIIGSGAAGIAAGKACYEEDIDYVCFEKTSRVAGLWNYREDDVEGEACVMKTTVINSSKEMTAFSDFPPPKEFPNYMHHTKMFKYLMMYAESFAFPEHIIYRREVQKVVKTSDYEKTGRWVVTIKNTEDKTVFEETFDGVMVCTGHHGFPHVPKFKGQENFEGKIIHTHSLKVPDAFKDQKVMVIGIGNSGLDSAVDLSNVAKQVYLSTRRGAWVMFRVGTNGLPVDTTLLTRYFDFLCSFFGWNTANAYVENEMNSKFDHVLYKLRPKHRFNGQHITVNDHLPNKILSGTVILKGDIDYFTEKGVVFQGDEATTKLDAVVLATGYKIKYPFLSRHIVDATNNQVELYKYSFPPHLKHPTLAIIGLIQPIGSLFPIFEAQSRWYVQLLKKRVLLPTPEVMMYDIKSKQQELAKRFVSSPRHTIQVDLIKFLDEIYSFIGAKPNLMKIALTDPLLFYKLFFGPGVSYQYRLEGPHSWPGARRAIIETHERIVCPLNTRDHTERHSILHSIYFHYVYHSVSGMFVFIVILIILYKLYDIYFREIF